MVSWSLFADPDIKYFASRFPIPCWNSNSPPLMAEPPSEKEILMHTKTRPD